MDSVVKYCIGVINKENGEITYYPKFAITNVFTPVAPSTNFNITIANGTDTATLICSEDNHLLNKSPYEMFELDVLPTVTTTVFNPLNDISKFVKNVNDNKFTPFCAPMQLWLNIESILTKDYLPKELILMAGITEEPKPNQKGELMCKMLLDRSVANCGIGFDQNFNSMDTDNTKLKKGLVEPGEPTIVVITAPGGGKAAAATTPSGGSATTTTPVTSTTTTTAPPVGGGLPAATSTTTTTAPPGGGLATATATISSSPPVGGSANPVSTEQVIIAIPAGVLSAAGTSLGPLPGGGSAAAATITTPVGGGGGGSVPAPATISSSPPVGGGSANPVSTEQVIIAIPAAASGGGGIAPVIIATPKPDSDPLIAIEYKMCERDMPRENILKQRVFVKVNPIYSNYEYYKFENKIDDIDRGDTYILKLYESRTQNLTNKVEGFKLPQLQTKFLWITTKDYEKIVANSADKIKAFVEIDGNYIYISGDRDDSKSGGGNYGKLVTKASNVGQDLCEYYFGNNVNFYEKGISGDKQVGCQLLKKTSDDNKFYLIYKSVANNTPQYYTQEIGTNNIKLKTCKDYDNIYVINPTTYLRYMLGQDPKKDKITTLKGAGLKRNLAIQSVMPRIYRPIQQRKTDYYNYA
jgi:hypothetical protein